MTNILYYKIRSQALVLCMTDVGLWWTSLNNEELSAHKPKVKYSSNHVARGWQPMHTHTLQEVTQNRLKTQIYKSKITTMLQHVASPLTMRNRGGRTPLYWLGEKCEAHWRSDRSARSESSRHQAGLNTKTARAVLFKSTLQHLSCIYIIRSACLNDQEQTFRHIFQ